MKLEMFNLTQDVKDRLAQLQINNYIKNALFLAVVALPSVWLYNSVTSSIKEGSEHRTNLIKLLNVPPLMTYFYTNFDKKIEDIKAEQSRLLKFIRTTKISNDEKKFTYNLVDYETDSTLNFDEFIMSSKPYKFYMKLVFIKRLKELETQGAKILLGANEYNVLEVTNRLNSIQDRAKLKKIIAIPINSYLDVLKYKNTKEHYEIMSDALLGYGYKSNIEKLPLVNTHSDIKKNIQQHYFKGLNSVRKLNGIDLSHPHSSLDYRAFKEYVSNDYAEKKGLAKKIHEKTLEDKLKAFEAKKLEIVKAEEKIINLEHLEKLIVNRWNIKYDYDEVSERIENKLDKLGV